MTIGLGGRAGAAALPVRGAPPFSASGSSLSRMMNTSLFESGDHEYSESRPLTSVNCCASPPRRSSTHTCVPFALPGRPEVNERYLPSGLQRGAPSESVLFVSWMFSEPSQLTIHTWPPLLSPSLSTVETV